MSVTGLNSVLNRVLPHSPCPPAFLPPLHFPLQFHLLHPLTQAPSFLPYQNINALKLVSFQWTTTALRSEVTGALEATGMPDFIPGSCHPPYLNGVSGNTKDPRGVPGLASPVKIRIFWAQFDKLKVNTLWMA